MLTLLAARASWRLSWNVLGLVPRPWRLLGRRRRDAAAGADGAVLAAARRVFVRLQKAWDRRDLMTLQELTLGQVFDDLRQTLAAVPGVASRTAIVSLDARLLGCDPVGDGHWLASVEFSGLVREGPKRPAAPFRELWMLVGVPSSRRGRTRWRLARVQALY